MLAKCALGLCATSLVAACTLGCSSESGSPPVEPKKTSSEPLLNLPALGPSQIRITGPGMKAIAPGEDITECTYLDWYSDRDYDIVESIGRQSELAAHHVVAFGVATSKPPGSAPCTDADMINATTFLGGGGAASAPLKMPNGVAMRLSKGVQVMVQHHWINTGAQPVDGTYAVDLTYADGGSAMQQAGMFLSANTVFKLPPGTETSATSDCTVQEPVKVFMLAGHAHELAKQVVISQVSSSGTKQIYDSGPWAEQYMFDPPRNNYTSEDPLVFSPGDHIVTECTWNNTTSADVTFPTEMCFAVTYYFPSTGNITCLDDAWQHAAAGML